MTWKNDDPKGFSDYDQSPVSENNKEESGKFNVGPIITLNDKPIISSQKSFKQARLRSKRNSMTSDVSNKSVHKRTIVNFK